MSKFYCSACESNVDLEDGRCPVCGADWNKVINKKVSSGTAKNVKVSSNNIVEAISSNIKKRDVESNIKFYLNWALAGKIYFIIMAIISFIISLVMIDETDGASLGLLVASVTFFAYAFIFENNLKWKAYLLQEIHELNYKKN